MPRSKRTGRRGGKNSKRVLTPQVDGEWINRDANIDMNNAAFEAYYKKQKIVRDEEWTDMLQRFREPLPSTFRISTHKSTATSLNNIVKDTFIPEMERSTFEGDAIPVPKSLPWFPGGLAWQISLPRKYLRKAPEYKRFHNFLVYESEAGNIARQEAVSMVPPLFLDVKPNHHVLDMCAAPGSKTAQLLEALQPVASDDANQPSELLESLLVANDSDHKRAQLLVHTTARRACPGLMVTSVDASIFPAVYRGQEGVLKGVEQVRFDRILADVPCSGDGTLRKNVGIWKTWSAREGSGLHSLQLRILQRAMALLKENSGSDNDRARIVYSTCSLNPIENEAVVAAALLSNPGYELVDVSSHLVDLKRRPGLTAWYPPFVKSKDEVEYFNSYADYVQSKSIPGATAASAHDENGYEEDVIGVNIEPATDELKPSTGGAMLPRKNARAQERRKTGAVLESMWPPDNVEELNLQRCMRFYPHLQDTGGFFVAVLQRRNSKQVSPSYGLPGSEMKAVGDELKGVDLIKRPPGLQEDRDEPALKRARKDVDATIAPISSVSQKVLSRPKQISSNSGGTYKENPFTFVDPVESGVGSNLDNLSLLSHFPVSNLYVRSPPGGPIRQLYLVNNVVKSIMQNTEPARIRLISAGVKVFGKSDLSRKGSDGGDSDVEVEGKLTQYASKQRDGHGIQFRITNEGLHSVLPYFNRERLLKGDAASLRMFLQKYYPLCVDFEEPFRSVMESTPPGSHVISFMPGRYGKSELVHELYLPLWKSGVSVSMMVDKHTKSALSLQLFGEDITVAAKARKGNEFTETGNEALDGVVDDSNRISPAGIYPELAQ